jgi:glycosyltransferase involved in cell wall biosynthesis
MRVGILHYSGPPIVGGVEHTIHEQASRLARREFEIRVIFGEGEPFPAPIETVRVPALYSKHPKVLEVKAGLDQGQIPAAFTSLTEALQAELAPAVAGLSVLIVHNVLSLHKNLALTDALFSMARLEKLPPVIAWHHDFAWLRPDYSGELYERTPWVLARQPLPGATHVVVSGAQQARLAQLYGCPAQAIQVIPPGIDPAVFGRWTRQTRHIIEVFRLKRASALLLLPARITRRKNIELALQVLAEARRQQQADIRLLVSGPPGPHNPANRTYLDELLELRRRLGLDQAAHFIYQLAEGEPFIADDETISDLFRLSDALFFPSKDEGFGIPLLEAALARLPIFCSNLAPFAESGQQQIITFDLGQAPQVIAASLCQALFNDPRFVLRHRALEKYDWEQVIDSQLLPLLRAVADG